MSCGSLGGIVGAVLTIGALTVGAIGCNVSLRTNGPFAKSNLACTAENGCQQSASDDEFSEKLRAGCAKSKHECSRLRTEAFQRAQSCRDGVAGRVPCDTARADTQAANTYMNQYYASEQQQAMDARARREAELKVQGEERRRDQKRKDREQLVAIQRHELELSYEQEQRTLGSCMENEAERAARRRHQDIVENRSPGETVRKQCKPRVETQTVQAECKDANGFTRSCMKTVAGDVVGYTCPKTLDPEVIQLGLFQLGLTVGYPYPEENTIHPDDEQCEQSKASALELKNKLDTLESSSKADAGSKP